jgi:hypothetical protein
LAAIQPDGDLGRDAGSRLCRNTARPKLAAFVQRQTWTAFLSAYARLNNGV